MKFLKKLAIAAAASTMIAGAAQAQTQGVTDDEILIGGQHDLSGIFASFSIDAVDTVNMIFEQVNEKGGIHGRKLRYIAEDHGYQMPKAIQAINKLVNGDEVFAMLLSLGTPMNIAAFPLQESKNVFNISPLTAARQMSEPLHPLRYSGTATYYDQIILGLPWLSKELGKSKVCTMYLPTDFGKEVIEGTKEVAEGMDGIEFVGETTHKPDEQDFVGALQRHASAGCQIITHALGVRQAIILSGTIKKLGLSDMVILGSSAGFNSVMATVPGGVTEGIYAAAGVSDPNERLDDPVVAEFFEQLKERKGVESISTAAMYGYGAAHLMIKALEAAGPELTVDSFQKALEGLSFEDKVAGNMVDFGPDDHQGADEIIVSVIKDGGWRALATLR